MKKPTELDKGKLDLAEIAKELAPVNGHGMKSAEDVLEWMNNIHEELMIFSAIEPGFEDWSGDDYARMMTKNHSEPYAFKTKNYVVMHDYV